MNQTISKNDWLIAQECLGRAWYGMRSGYEAPTEAELFRMEQGQEIGNLARKLYPSGTLVEKHNGAEPEQITGDACSSSSTQSLFEAAARAGIFVAKADILARDSSGWHVLEVKSSLSDTKKMTDYVDDLAYTVMVFRRCGFQITKASLVLLSRSYCFGQPTEKLFETLDKTDEVNDRVTEFDAQADDVARILFDQSQPAPKLVSACRDCAAYATECLASGLDHTVLEIPRLHHTRLERLSQEGIVDLSRLPGDLKLNDKQKRAVSAMNSGNVIVESGLREALDNFEWPCHYLDFETVATVLPLYEGHGCHRQVLTQFSIHHRDSLGAEPTHSEFLADVGKNCERELAEALIESLGDRGTVVMYSPFEKTRISKLQESFPDLAAPLQKIVDRLRDMERIVEDNVYHPEFQGSFSIKQVMPALVPDLSYEGLAVRDGDTAITRFARMARGEIVGKEAEAIRRQLLDYCRMDTLAMVRLHDALHRLADGVNPKTPDAAVV